jgi:hypothetical protein
LLLLLLLQTELTAYEKFSEPREVDVLRVIPNKKEMGTAFKKVRCQPMMCMAQGGVRPL